MSAKSVLSEQTVQDFGDQWTRFQENSGYYASLSVFQDILGPLLDTQEIKGAVVADIGSGTGRIVNMLLDADAKCVRAVEPSAAYHVLVENTKERKDRVEYIQATGDKLPGDCDLDYVFSIGVLHHIPEPDGAVKAAFRALKPGGRMLIWLYGREGNGFYLSLALPLRAITRRLPDRALEGVSYVLDALLQPYIWASRLIWLPLRDYLQNHYAKLTPAVRRLTIFDQLNPGYAMYYTEREASGLLERNGFSDVKLHHRHGYSWTVIGTKK